MSDPHVPPNTGDLSASADLPSSRTSQPAAPARRQSRRAAPNYAARRMLVTTIGITVVAIAGLAAWQLLGDGASGGSTTSSARWDHVALVDRTNGDVTTVDQDGEVQDEIAGRSRALAVHANGSRLAIVGRTEVIVVDPGSDEITTVPIQAGSTVTRIPTGRSLDLVVGTSAGGNVTVVDGETGNVLDFGALAGQTDPLLFADTIRHDAEGTAFAVADAANFQTVVVRDGETEATFLPDAPVAVGDDRIATSQTVGQRADIGLFDVTGKRLTSVGSTIPAGGVVHDGALVYVADDGGIFRVDGEADEPERLGVLAMPGGSQIRFVQPILGGERLVIGGDVFEAIVDLDGTTIFATTFTQDNDLPSASEAWACLPVGGELGFHSIVDAETGEQIADLSDLEVTDVAADGCTVLGTRSNVTRLVSAAGDISVGATRAAALSPDGFTVVLQKTTGAWQMITYDDELQPGEPVDLSESAPTSALIAFIED